MIYEIKDEQRIIVDRFVEYLYAAICETDHEHLGFSSSLQFHAKNLCSRGQVWCETIVQSGRIGILGQT